MKHGISARGARRLASAALLAVSALTAARPAAAGVCGEAPGPVLERIIAADNARNLEAALAEYTPDVVWIPPGRPRLIGIEAIRKSYEDMYATFSPALTVTVEQSLADRSLAIVSGVTKGTLTPAAGELISVHDHYVAALKCIGGHWRVAQLFWAAEPK